MKKLILIAIILLFLPIFITSKISYVRAETPEDNITLLASIMRLDEGLVRKVIMCESKGKQSARGTLAVVGTDIGVMQINSHFHEKTAKNMGLDIYQEEDNLLYGMLLMKKEGLKPWKSSQKCWDK